MEAVAPLDLWAAMRTLLQEDCFLLNLRTSLLEGADLRHLYLMPVG